MKPPATVGLRLAIHLPPLWLYVLVGLVVGLDRAAELLVRVDAV